MKKRQKLVTDEQWELIEPLLLMRQRRKDKRGRLVLFTANEHSLFHDLRVPGHVLGHSLGFCFGFGPGEF
jgi:hypothetical protein